MKVSSPALMVDGGARPRCRGLLASWSERIQDETSPSMRGRDEDDLMVQAQASVLKAYTRKSAFTKHVTASSPGRG